MAASAEVATPAARRYWNNLLAGTQGLTSLNLKTTEKPTNMSSFFYVSPKLNNGSFRNKNITFYTALKAAWAHLLAKYTSSTDVVFANLVSGRTADLQNIDSLIGAAINLLPVRAHVPADSTPEQLCDEIQKQHAESMPYEFMDYTDICDAAGWSDRTTLKTIVQHQNMKEVDATDAGIGDEGAKWGFWQKQPVAGEFEAWIISVERENGMEVGVGFDEAIMDSVVAKKMAKELGEMMEKMAGVSGGWIKEDIAVNGAEKVENGTEKMEKQTNGTTVEVNGSAINTDGYDAPTNGHASNGTSNGVKPSSVTTTNGSKVDAVTLTKQTIEQVSKRQK
jgi:hypothetical protein